MPDIHPVFREVPALAKAVLLAKLASGPASDSWLVEDDGARLIVRIDNPRARRLGLDRHAELEVLESVSSAAIGPDVIRADPAVGLLVTSFIPGAVWTREKIRDPASLEQLAMVLRRLHALPPVGPIFDPGKAALAYAQDIGTGSAFELARKAAGLTDQLLTAGYHRALCHNDLVYRNVIGSNPARLIDWEYAGVGDPFFDLAVVIRHHELPATLARGFIKAYFGSVDATTWERLKAFCILYDLVSALWYMSICNGHDDDSKYVAELDRVLSRMKD